MHAPDPCPRCSRTSTVRTHEWTAAGREYADLYCIKCGPLYRDAKLLQGAAPLPPQTQAWRPSLMRRAIDAFFLWTGKLLARWVELGERRLAESRVDALCDRFARGEPIPRAEVDATCKPLGMTFDQWREQARKRHADRELQRS